MLPQPVIFPGETGAPSDGERPGGGELCFGNKENIIRVRMEMKS